MKNLNLLVLLLIVVSCGEATVFYPKAKKEISKPTQEARPAPTPIVATPEQFKTSPIVVDEGLVIPVQGKPESATASEIGQGHVVISNADPDTTYQIEYRLERNESIRLKEPEVRTIEIAPTASIKIPVLYIPEQNNPIRIDQMVITYFSKTDPEIRRTINYPIRGEVIPTITNPPIAPVIVPNLIQAPLVASITPAVVVTMPSAPINSNLPEIETLPLEILEPAKLPELDIDTPSSIRVTTVANRPIQDFGTTVVGTVIDAHVIITNLSPFDIRINPRMESLTPFRIKDPRACPELLKVGEDCTLTIIFETKRPGVHQEELTIEHTSTRNHDPRIARLPVLGVKIEDLDTCNNEPCSTPYTEGTLISSEVFSNDIDFGTVHLGTEVKKQVEIQNKGTTALRLKNHTLDDQGVFNFSGGSYPGLKGTCGDIILPGSCVVELIYHPKAIQKDKGSLKMKTKEGPSVTVKLSGMGTQKKSCDSYNEYLVVPEKSYPDNLVKFPYYKTARGTTAELFHLYGMQVNYFVPEIKENTVKDAMVYITFKLPEMEGEIVSMNFGVNVFKVITDKFKDTESLCLSSQDVRKCSGHEFSLARWQKLKNPSFWNLVQKPVNDLYIKQLEFGENKCGEKNCMSLNTNYELKNIFELSMNEFSQLRSQGLFSLIFSDDTRLLTMPRIYVKTKISKVCQ